MPAERRKGREKDSQSHRRTRPAHCYARPAVGTLTVFFVDIRRAAAHVQAGPRKINAVAESRRCSTAPPVLHNCRWRPPPNLHVCICCVRLGVRVSLCTVTDLDTACTDLLIQFCLISSLAVLMLLPLTLLCFAPCIGAGA